MRTTLVGEPPMANIRKGDIIQMQRLGFRICDAEFVAKSEFTGQSLPSEFIVVPDGHVKSSASSVSSAAEVSSWRFLFFS
jgi:bifunctional glutamyl/prolyl-tRNA synthetase